MKLGNLTSILSCPDDQARLELKSDFLRCIRCGREYPVLGNNFVEILPVCSMTHHGDKSEYWQRYQIEYERSFVWIENAKAWGRYDLACSSWAEKRLRQVEYVKSMLDETRAICDVSAGAGTYTFEFAKAFPLVIHCDLSVENLNDVYKRKQQNDIKNIILIRCDYFNLPFKNSLRQLICTDTLIRGRQHENLLLNSLYNALAYDGQAVIDFHNWWHNPLRRLGLMPQNFVSNKSYTRQSAEKILCESGIRNYSYSPFYQEIPFGADAVLQHVIPPTRLMYHFQKVADENSSNT